MRMAVVILLLCCSACGAAPQPDSNRTVAAFEIPLPNQAARKQFLDVLNLAAASNGYHLDAATDEELKVRSEVSPITMNAAVWRGRDDNEAIASVMDLPDNLGRVWITFAKGENQEAATAFRTGLMREVNRRWPQTATLPIMPTGAIPLPRDLIRTPSGYVVNPSAKTKYDRPTS